MDIEFHDDFDIFNLYVTLINKFENDMTMISYYEREMKRFLVIARRSHRLEDRRLAMFALRYIKRILPGVTKGTLVHDFARKVSGYVREYKKISGGPKIFGVETCKNIPKRVGIIIGFLKEIRYYYPIEWKCTYDLSNVCSKCFSRMKKRGKIYICSCGNICPIPITHKVRLDKSGVKRRSSYVPDKNFQKEYAFVCGAENTVVSDEIEIITAHLYKNKQIPPTHDDIRNAIRVCGYENYRDTNYIYSMITREDLPPLMEYIGICNERFKSYYSVFQVLPEKEGTNITNLHFLFKLFLYQEEIPYNNDWFRTLAKDTEQKHIRNARKICKILQQEEPEKNWEYPPQWDL